MSKLLKYILFIFCAGVMQSCVKDMQDDLNDGGWNNERSVTSLKFKNQVGQAEIERIDDATGEVTVTLNVGAISDLSKVEIESIELSYQSTASAGKGSTLDFSNPERKSVLTVTSATGKIREYIIYVNEFRESLEGTWSINNLIVYGGTGPEWGGGRVYPFMDKPWCWYDEYSPEKEFDNTLTFIMENITDDGNTSGKCINAAGPDGKYADFIFKGSSNPADKTDIDLKKYYRKIPVGESRWIRNYSLGTITFIDADGNESTAVLENPGTYTLFQGGGYTNMVTLPNNAFSFQISGVDEWDYIYTDYDVFAKQARKLFVLVTKNGN